jgi:hypothetical protein
LEKKGVLKPAKDLRALLRDKPTIHKKKEMPE